MNESHTPGPWIVADSCSWRRIVKPDMTPVITPVAQQPDGHPDLLAKRADLDLAARAPELLAENQRLTAENTEQQNKLDAVTRLTLRAGSDRDFDDNVLDCLDDILEGRIALSRTWMWGADSDSGKQDP